ncbi:MAG TPA: L,D-transpeptidase family protein [Vicinamibacteria bacterium]|nr:L,D-transpeptidase family protein [Vicinamibacteria bacterium]
MLAAAASAPASADERVSHFLRLHLESGLPPYALGDAKASRLWAAVQAFYTRRDCRAAWGARTVEVQGLLQRAADRGLDPAGYRLPGPPRDDDDRARADAQLSYALAHYASDLAEGRFDPHGATYYWSVAPVSIDLTAFLEEAAAAPRVVDVLTRLEPDHDGYRSLVRALARYRSLAAAGGWPSVTTAASLKPGTRGPAVVALRRRLAASGELPLALDANANTFDAPLADALRRFQSRHGLEADGVAGKDTVAALNVPVDARIRQIELSLERWRWLPRPLGRRWIAVNIPTFMLYGFDGGRPALAMRVITGRTESPTPVFSQPMQEVIFRPYWNVPPGIAANEIVPAVLRRPDYLARNGLEVVRGDGGDVSFRQRPGPGNSLGLVKFVLPNPFNVYLHDTPHDQLFARSRRDFSHGCMRVERPAELAQWVLAPAPEWTPRAVAAAMRSGDERHVPLPQPVPVYVVYMTAWATSDGSVSFGPDLYGHDAIHDTLLARARAVEPAAAPVLASGGSPE